MPSDTADNLLPPLTGRRSCGARTVPASALPCIVAPCHRGERRPVSGAAIAAMARGPARFDRSAGDGVSVNDGARHRFCGVCGSPLGATYANVSNQMHVVPGMLDRADRPPRARQAQSDHTLTWVHLSDDLPLGSGRSGDRLGSPGRS